MHHCRARLAVVALVALVGIAVRSTPAAAAVPCDDPYLIEILETQPTGAPVLRRAVLRPRTHETRFMLGASLGYALMTGFTRLSAPSVEAVAALRFGGGVSEHLGLRLTAFAATNLRSAQDGMPGGGSGGSSDDGSDARAYGLSLAVEIRWNNGLWLAPGLGVLHYRGRLAHIACDVSFGEGGSCGPNELTVPELTLGLGWEIPLSRSIAVQLAAQAGTAILTLRGGLYAGLRVQL